jgi:hypothetical protein
MTISTLTQSQSKDLVHQHRAGEIGAFKQYEKPANDAKKKNEIEEKERSEDSANSLAAMVAVAWSKQPPEIQALAEKSSGLSLDMLSSVAEGSSAQQSSAQQVSQATQSFGAEFDVASVSAAHLKASNLSSKLVEQSSQTGEVSSLVGANSSKHVSSTTTPSGKLSSDEAQDRPINGLFYQRHDSTAVTEKQVSAAMRNPAFLAPESGFQGVVDGNGFESVFASLEQNVAVTLPTAAASEEAEKVEHAMPSQQNLAVARSEGRISQPQMQQVFNQSAHQQTNGLRSGMAFKPGSLSEVDASLPSFVQADGANDDSLGSSSSKTMGNTDETDTALMRTTASLKADQGDTRDLAESVSMMPSALTSTNTAVAAEPKQPSTGSSSKRPAQRATPAHQANAPEGVKYNLRSWGENKSVEILGSAQKGYTLHASDREVEQALVDHMDGALPDNVVIAGGTSLSKTPQGQLINPLAGANQEDEE